MFYIYPLEKKTAGNPESAEERQQSIGSQFSREKEFYSKTSRTKEKQKTKRESNNCVAKTVKHILKFIERLPGRPAFNDLHSSFI